MSPADLFKKLWEHVNDNDVIVLYGAPLGAAETDANGLYAPAGTRGKFQTRHEILLPRTGKLPQPQNEPDDTQPMYDACTLAHEFGHRLSDVAKNRTAAYVRAVTTPHDQWQTMPESDRRLIYDEEVRAWRLGRETLDVLKCDEWTAFDERERSSLATYRRLLALDD